MSISEAYNQWAGQYDNNVNRTRDLEAISLRETLEQIRFSQVIEIGCGTGKNTVWLAERAEQVLAVDFSAEMLRHAKEKNIPGKVIFVQADITQPWDFTREEYDLAVFSLVLEHISDLHAVIKKTAALLRPGGYLYIGELHPFKQYTGTKARFEDEKGIQELTCFTHHVSDFTDAASACGFSPLLVREYFDEGDRNGIPRILSLLFRKDDLLNHSA